MHRKQLIIEVMESVSKRTCAYLESEFKINATENDSDGGKLETIVLLDMTAIIVMGGAINLLVVFSFEESLINAIFREMTEGLGIEANEVETYRHAAAGDVINTVLGHSTIDLQKLDKTDIRISPPKILEDVKTIQKMEYMMFYAQNLITPLGKMTISLVGSDELFSKIFCVVE